MSARVSAPGDPPGAVRGHVLTVPPGHAFLEALARAILAGDLPAPAGRPPDRLDLPRWTILLPTRRAARALQEGFLRAAGGSAMLLPAIRPIAEADEDLDLVERALARASGIGDAGGAELPPAIAPLARRLVLTRLVLAWSQSMRAGSGRFDGTAGIAAVAGAGSTAQALGLAGALARLMDDVETEGASLAGLADLVPEDLAGHWQQTVEFLEIVTAHWPAHLAELGLVSPAERRNRAIAAEARRIAAEPLAAPVIVAGVTGSVPATAELMRAVIADRLGAVVLPALDQNLDAATWALLGERPEHPQHGFHHLLRRLGVERERVGVLAGLATRPGLALRSRLVSEALRPAGTLGHWRALTRCVDPGQAAEALDGLALVEAATAEEEAETVALMLRRAAETPGRTAALVSPDRLLARRVAIRLAAWGIRVDDSAGRPLAKTMPGAFLDLVVGALASRFAPAAVMALLKHPLTRLGLDAGTVRRLARRLEIAVFRKPYLGSGMAGIRAGLAAGVHDAGEGARLVDLVDRLEQAFAPLAALAAGRELLPLQAHVRAHADVAEALSARADGEAGGLWQDEAGEAAAALVATLTDPALAELRLPAADYPDLWRALITGETVRPRVPVHPRLYIWGPYEARLQQPDLVILGSLNEGTWPAAADPGPWLNRGMRRRLGLPVPEVETGRAAHDLATFLGAPDVVLTRAAKVDGTPTVRSRWVERLIALVDGLDAGRHLAPREPLLGWARARDHAEPAPPITPPQPSPPLALRPRRASLSDIARWSASPYTIFASRVLRLQPMPELGARPGPREQGTMLHRALRDFVEQYGTQLPPDAAAELVRLANEVVREMSGAPNVAAFWLPRLGRFARWFAETEPARRAGVVRIAVEVDGQHVIEAPGGPFTLTARADRIDLAGGHAIITDYKTGEPPRWKKVAEGFEPQLPLEAALLALGAFDGFDPTPIAGQGLRYIRASGGEPAGNEGRIDADGERISGIAQTALAGAIALVRRFDNDTEPYRVGGRLDAERDPYAHLARVAEWRGGDGGEDA